MTHEEYEREDLRRSAEAAQLHSDPAKWQEWLTYAADMLRRVVINQRDGDDYERNAALIAIQALEWLAKPPETIRIIKKRQPIVIGDGQGGSIHIGDWPPEGT